MMKARLVPNAHSSAGSTFPDVAAGYLQARPT